MIRVFIYHNQMDRLNFLHKTMTKYFQEKRCAFRLVSSGRYSEALRYVKDEGGNMDLFFIDFMDYKQGIRLASCLREKNNNAFWVYVDGGAEHLYQAMLLQPSAYIPEDMSSQELLMTLQRLEQYYQMIQQSNYFHFKCEGEYVRIPFEEISCFESSAKKVMLKLVKEDKRYYFTAKLDDIEKQLPDYFLRCHQSYLVNMHMIQSMDMQNHVFFLYSNEEILISRRNYKESKERYRQFMEERH